jgi:hypothetical protein
LTSRSPSTLDKNKANEMSFDSPEFNSRTAESVNDGIFLIELIVLSDNADQQKFSFKMSHEKGSAEIVVSDMKH